MACQKRFLSIELQLIYYAHSPDLICAKCQIFNFADFDILIAVEDYLLLIQFLINNQKNKSIFFKKMAEELRRSLHQILLKTDGLYGIILTDRDGVTILKAHLDPPNNPSVNLQSGVPIFPDAALRLNFLGTFATATEQASKLGMGRNEKIISIYQKYQVIQFNKLPVVVTLVAKKDANTGYLVTTMDQTLSPLVNAIRKDVTAYYHSHLLHAGDV